MPLVPMRLLLDHAAENDYGLAAFNVNNMEQIQAIMAAAEETESPVIIQASRGARKYSQDAYLRHLMLAAAELHPNIPIVMHQDHGNSPETCQSAIDNGFTSVMMDGSLKEDGKHTGRLRLQRRRDEEGGRDRPTSPGRLGRGRTRLPRIARDGRRRAGGRPRRHGGAFARSTADRPGRGGAVRRRDGVDALAVAIGTSHGAYKFTKKPTGDVLAMDRIEEIHKRLPNCHLVMHGSSSVPQDLQDIINRVRR